MAERRNPSGDRLNIRSFFNRKGLKKGRVHLQSTAQRSSSSSPSGCEDFIFNCRVHADDSDPSGWQFPGNGSGSPLAGGHRQNGSNPGYNSQSAGTPLRGNYGHQQGEDAHSPPRQSNGSHHMHAAGSMLKVLKVLGADNVTETKDILSCMKDHAENGYSPERWDRHSDGSPRDHMMEGRGAPRPRTPGQHIDLDTARRSHWDGQRAATQEMPLEPFRSDGGILFRSLGENEDSDSRSLSPKSDNSPGEVSVTTVEQSWASTPQLSPRADGHRSPIASPRGTHASVGSPQLSPRADGCAKEVCSGDATLTLSIWLTGPPALALSHSNEIPITSPRGTHASVGSPQLSPRADGHRSPITSPRGTHPSVSTPQLSPRADGHRSPIASPRGTHASLSSGGWMNGTERLQPSYGMVQGSNQVGLTDATRHPLPAPPPSSPRAKTALGARSPARRMTAAEEFRQREHVESRTRSSQQVSHGEIAALREGLRGIDNQVHSLRQSPQTRYPWSPRMAKSGAVYPNGKLPAGKNGARHMDHRQTARMSPQPSPQHSPRGRGVGIPGEDLGRVEHTFEHSPPHPSTSTSPRPSMDSRLFPVEIPAPQPSASASVPVAGGMFGTVNQYSPHPSPYASPQVSPRMDQSSIHVFPNHEFPTHPETTGGEIPYWRPSLLSPPPSPDRSPQKLQSWEGIFDNMQNQPCILKANKEYATLINSSVILGRKEYPDKAKAEFQEWKSNSSLSGDSPTQLSPQVRSAVQQVQHIAGRYPNHSVERGQRRGLAMIVSIEKDRPGGAVDRGRLEALLKTLKFDTEIVVDDPKEIKVLLRQLAEIPGLAEDDCFLCCINAHGGIDDDGREYIVIKGAGSEKLYVVDDILKPITESRFLADKPKVFVINACRGSGWLIQSKKAEDSEGESSQVVSKRAGDIRALHSVKDCLIVFSTSHGQLSFRDTEAGTHFITALMDAIVEGCQTADVLSILTSVIGKVSEVEVSVRGEAGMPPEKKFQCPEVHTTLTRGLYWSLP